VEDALLDFITSNGQAIRARALVSCAKARRPIRGADDEPRASITAFRQSGEQVTRTVASTGTDASAFSPSRTPLRRPSLPLGPGRARPSKPSATLRQPFASLRITFNGGLVVRPDC